jgi:hypothetical protein
MQKSSNVRPVIDAFNIPSISIMEGGQRRSIDLLWFGN